MNQEILELLAEKKYSAVKQLIGQMEEADLAKLFEELENEEDADPVQPGCSGCCPRRPPPRFSPTWSLKSRKRSSGR